MKNLLRLLFYGFLALVWSCTDHRLPPAISCDDVATRIAGCANWKLTSRTVNAVEAITPCQQGLILTFPGGKLSGQFVLLKDPEYCGTGGAGGGTYTCSNGTVTLSKTVTFGGFNPIGPISQTIAFLSPTSFLITYTDANRNAIVETYVANCP
ncbi:hypothetical protein [Spirosoma panaciterrae]|uniref:hypothetical protein n=1 Tax=Spirosoma panaciterrae TaxID=496058 RepID=UPI00036F255E|nr:hypothetical protein [Spirosoma panaciterrae]